MKNLLLQVSRNVMLHIKVGNTKPKHTCDALSRNNLFWVERADILGLAICKMTYETINFLKSFCWQWQIHLSKSNISRSFLDTKWHIQIDFTDETLQTVSNFWKRSSTVYPTPNSTGHDQCSYRFHLKHRHCTLFWLLSCYSPAQVRCSSVFTSLSTQKHTLGKSVEIDDYFVW